MIGAIVYVLRAENSAQMSFINGRLMHAAFFNIINNFSRELGDFIHNELNIKPFTVSFIEPVGKISSSGGRWQVRRGDRFFWRVTCLDAEILRAALSVQIDEKIQAGALNLRVDEIICNAEVRADSGVVEIEDFISDVKKIPSFREIGFNFVSPVSFRVDDFDAPYPRAELIFSSLADKWTQAQMPAVVDKKIIRELATQIRLTQWHGQSRKFYLSRDRGTLAFFGKFFFNVENLPNDVRKAFLLLAKFGEFAGVGRLTGQGFGQVRIIAE